jgi:hypothetical protein
LMFSDYHVEQVSKSLSFKICFVFDVRCANEFVEILKLYISIALRAIKPGTEFLFICLHNTHVSFLKIRGGRGIFIDYPNNSKIFELTAIEYLQNSSTDVESIIEFISDISNISGDFTDTHFENMFIPTPPNIFINFIVFTSSNISMNNTPNMSFDIVSPVSFKTHPNINGLFFSQKNVEDLNLQVQALVQRLTPDNFALNVEVNVITPPLIEVTPSSIQMPSVRSGHSQVFRVSLAKTISSIAEIPIEIVTTYDIPISDKQVIHRTVVTSRKYQTSKNFFAILSTVDPVVACQGMQLTKEFIINLINMYSSKVCQVIPGTSKTDPYFTLVPSLRWFLRFYLYKKKGAVTSFLIDEESEISCFFPQISFWDNQNTLSCNNICAVSFEEEMAGNPPIVIVDSNYKIDIFGVDEIEPDSEISKFIQMKVSNRFPVPRIAKKPRSKLLSLVPPEENYNEIIRNIPSV